MLVYEGWECLVCRSYEKTWFCCHMLPMWNGRCVWKRWAMWLLSAVPRGRSTAGDGQCRWLAGRLAQEKGSQMLLAFLTLASGCQKTLHKGAVKYMEYCPRMWLLQYQRMLVSVCSWEWTWLYISQCRKSWSPAPGSGAKTMMNLTKPGYLLLSWTLVDLND